MQRWTLNLVLIATFVVLVQSQYTPRNEDVSCKDDEGNDVDWFMVHKLPTLRMPETPDVAARERLRDGKEYRFFLSTSRTAKWTRSVRSIQNENSMIGRTLKQATNANVLGVWYNNDPPEGAASSELAHSKGSVLVHVDTRGVSSSGATGVWLSHSVPKFHKLGRGTTYNYPSAGLKNGSHLYTMQARVFDVSGPAELIPQLQSLSPDLYRLTQTGRANDFPAGSTTLNVFNINTRGGSPMAVKLFSKSKRGIFDVWSRVALELRVNVTVQSWHCGTGGPTLPRECDATNTFCADNIKWLSSEPYKWLPAGNAVAVSKYKRTKDHSKFAFSEEASNPQVCIGDLNRRRSQKEGGGGGAACFSHDLAWTTLKQLHFEPPVDRGEPMDCEDD